MAEKFYEPTGDDALGAYKVAAVAHNLWPEAEYEQPCHAWQTVPGAFYVLLSDFYEFVNEDGTKNIDENGNILAEVTSCLYDREKRLWLVSLENGIVAKVRHTEDNFVVVAE